MHAATRLADGRVLITGGMTSRETLSTASAEIFDPATGASRLRGDMHDARALHAASAPRRRPRPGGRRVRHWRSIPTHWTPLSSAEVFDPGTGSFIPRRHWRPNGPGLGSSPCRMGRCSIAGGSNDLREPHEAPNSSIRRRADSSRPAQARLPTVTPGSGSSRTATSSSSVVPRIPAPTACPSSGPRWSRPRAGTGADDAGPAGFHGPSTTSTVSFVTGHTATAPSRWADPPDWWHATPGSRQVRPSPLPSCSTRRPAGPGPWPTCRRPDPVTLRSSSTMAVFWWRAARRRDCPAHRVAAAPRPASHADSSTRRRAGFTRLSADLGPSSRSPGGRLARCGAARGRPGALHRFEWVDDDHRPRDAAKPAVGGSSRSASESSRWFGSRTAGSSSRWQRSAGGPLLSIFDVASQETGTTLSDGDWDASVVLADGRVLVVRATGEAAIFDPASSTFTPTGSMARRDDPDPTNRYREPYRRRLTLLADGRILVTGGRSLASASEPAADADLFDPSTGTFRSIGPMLEPRTGHSATLLDDGRAVIIGGRRPFGRPDGPGAGLRGDLRSIEGAEMIARSRLLVRSRAGTGSSIGC